LFFIF
jgi:WD repeat-containing protein 68